MKKILRSESGTVVSMAVAIIVILVSGLSTISLVGLVQTDQVQTQYQHDMIQEELLLRSENQRTHLAIEFNSERPLPERNVEIIEPGRITTYKIKNTFNVETVSNFMGYATEQVVAIKSLISAKRARLYISKNEIPVKRMTERLLRNESLAQYQYFTDIERSENEDGGPLAARVKFWGPDVLYGKVHSNDDIWIQQGGGGSNEGWPTFYDQVTTAGIFKKHPGGEHLPEVAPMDQIFQGPEPAWQEEVPAIIFEPNAEDIRQNGVWLFDDLNIDIAYVNINGSGYTSMVANIQLAEIEEFTVYSWYPANAAQANEKVYAGNNWFEEADSLWVNHVPIYDTIWTNGPSGSVINLSVFVNDCELWIEGEISGKQTWGCSDTIYIVGDIKYEGTQLGALPDDPGNLNRTDYFGLVSEKKLIIRYKHRDPETGEIMAPNCNDVYMYGAYAAIGKGDEALYGEMACHHDGIFTFQYQHPHGSTPNFTALSPYTLEETLYTYIDFHKYIYPINNYVHPNIQGFNLHGAPPPDGLPCGYNYEDPFYIATYPDASEGNPYYNYTEPYGTDWPWYNPVWPEDRRDIVYERGTLHIFGAIAQRRRGFVHRSGEDPYNHPDQYEWDIDEYHYDGEHPSTGYAKDYHYDQRFLFVQPPDYPQVYTGWGTNILSSFDEQTWFFKTPGE